eukprot:6210120-Pleurochrysis_carterae.AAC.4
MSEPSQRLSSTMRCWSISTTSTACCSSSGTCVQSTVFKPSATSTKLSTSSTVEPSEADRLMSALRKSANMSSCSWRQRLLSSKPRQMRGSSTRRATGASNEGTRAWLTPVSPAAIGERACA